MPVNTATLKTFAPAMRRQLIEAVGRKLDRMLTGQTPDTLTTYASQIAELREQEKENRAVLLERVAYTWFNRLSALRYLDARGWHPFGAKVLMPATEAETQPELLKLIRAGSLPVELNAHANESRLQGLLDGQIPTAIAGADPEGEVYRELVLATCRFYHQLLPNLFEELDDATELLLPDDLITETSIAAKFRSSISDADCDDVELLGWLYQFYIAEKKDEVMARKKAVPTEDIPAVTQLFTPHWIVRYLVENSLGRLWLLNRPGSNLREQMPYYIEGEPETDFLKINKPEEIKLLDPACGSGHMLTYAFDLLTLIYEEEGYAPTEIPGLILKNNLFGLEICPRAAQLAELALVFKGPQKPRRFFQPEHLVRPRIIELRDVRFEENELHDYIHALGLGDLFHQPMLRLLHQFEEAKNFGSLIQPCLDERAIANARRAITAAENRAKVLGGQLFLRETHGKVLRVLEQAEALTQRYHVVVANPPYMGGGGMNEGLRAFAKKLFEDSKADLYSMFIQRAATLVVPRGFSAMVTMQSWMFLSSFEELRASLLENGSFVTLAQIGYNSFPEMNSKIAQACAFVFNHVLKQEVGIFVNLNDAPQAADKELVFLEKVQSSKFYRATANKFQEIPGSPIAYWLSDAALKAFRTFPPLSQAIALRKGLTTMDNNRFLRFWHEVARSRSKFDAVSAADAKASGACWFLCLKGGGSRKWFGLNDYVINWQDDGRELKKFISSLYGGASYTKEIRSENEYFKPSITWTTLTSSSLSMRFNDAGSIFESKGSVGLAKGEANALATLAFANSRVATVFLQALSPTLDFNAGPVGRVPYCNFNSAREIELATDCIRLARADWDNFETSWNFTGLPLLRPGLKGLAVEASWRNWEAQSTAAIRRMQELETENNRLFIAAYGLDGELQPEVPEEQITLARAEARTDVAAFISYAVGCMMGRYSLDHPGLILANAGDTLHDFLERVGKPLADLAFAPDEDGIIPVLDGEWFEDDVVARCREFLRVSFPESSLGADLGFIETSLGKDIRKYFTADFYKDHLQTYKKRPIYWLVQSPKKSFACLIYLHRYTKDTLNLVLNNYLRPYIQKLEARLAQLGLDQLNDDLPAKDRAAARKEGDKISKALRECQDWEREALLPLAQQRIELDLDDGVKVNYLKLQAVLAPIPGLAAKEE